MIDVTFKNTSIKCFENSAKFFKIACLVFTLRLKRLQAPFNFSMTPKIP